MKRINKLAIIAALSLLCSAGAFAQSFRSGYFLDNYVYGYRINPAQINEKSFFALGLGNMDLQHNCTVGISSFLFPTESGVVTGFNNAVSAEQFLGGIPNGMRISMNENINLLSFGVRGKKSMHTFEVNVRATAGMALPYDLFAFLKVGGDQPYDISGINLSADAVADVAYGFSTSINSRLRVGGRLHVLVGVADVKAYSASSSITMGAAQSELKTKLLLQTSGMPSMGIDADGHLDPSQMAINGPYIGGYGAGLDLGAEYEPVPGLSIMASVTELGAISRQNTTNLVADNTVTYQGADITYQDGSVQADFKAVLEELMKAIVFEEGPAGRRLDWMPFNVALGARYKMPFFKALSAGVLGTCHFEDVAPWWEVRGGLTLSTRYLVSITGNAGYGTFGPTAGGALNLHLGPLNLLAGVDSFMGNLGRIGGISGVPGIPAPLGGFAVNGHFGMTLTFGKFRD